MSVKLSPQFPGVFNDFCYARFQFEKDVNLISSYDVIDLIPKLLLSSAVFIWAKTFWGAWCVCVCASAMFLLGFPSPVLYTKKERLSKGS